MSSTNHTSKKTCISNERTYQNLQIFMDRLRKDSQKILRNLPDLNGMVGIKMVGQEQRKSILLNDEDGRMMMLELSQNDLSMNEIQIDVELSDVGSVSSRCSLMKQSI